MNRQMALTFPAGFAMRIHPEHVVSAEFNRLAKLIAERCDGISESSTIVHRQDNDILLQDPCIASLAHWPSSEAGMGEDFAGKKNGRDSSIILPCVEVEQTRLSTDTTSVGVFLRIFFLSVEPGRTGSDSYTGHYLYCCHYSSAGREPALWILALALTLGGLPLSDFVLPLALTRGGPPPSVLKCVHYHIELKLPLALTRGGPPPSDIEHATTMYTYASELQGTGLSDPRQQVPPYHVVDVVCLVD